MFKIIKDNKIIGISETTPTLLDDYGVVETDELVSDYIQINGEYILSADEPIESKNEKIRAERQARYVAESDILKLDYDEALARNSDDLEEKRDAWLSSKDKIRAELPYFEGVE